jgi:hypothetical protein
MYIIVIYREGVKFSRFPPASPASSANKLSRWIGVEGFEGVIRILVFASPALALAADETFHVQTLAGDLIARAIGSPDYRLSAIWWLGVVAGLFSWVTPWLIIVPFIALAMPLSVRKLKKIVDSVRR